eukprot:2884183-Rhodomonas_salina.1
MPHSGLADPHPLEDAAAEGVSVLVRAVALVDLLGLLEVCERLRHQLLPQVRRREVEVCAHQARVQIVALDPQARAILHQRFDQLVVLVRPFQLLNPLRAQLLPLRRRQQLPVKVILLPLSLS